MIVTHNNVKTFLGEYGDARLAMNADVTSDFVEVLKEILKRNSNFESLKKELTDVIEERTDFISWLDKHRDEKSGDYKFDFL